LNLLSKEIGMGKRGVGVIDICRLHLLQLSLNLQRIDSGSASEITAREKKPFSSANHTSFMGSKASCICMSPCPSVCFAFGDIVVE
jgi:hypothetical protein